MREHGTTGRLGFSQGITDWSAADDRACVQMEAGPDDILVHHSLTIHRANNNTSDRERRAIGFIFYRADVEIDEVAHAAYQERLRQSLKDAGRI